MYTNLFTLFWCYLILANLANLLKEIIATTKDLLDFSRRDLMHVYIFCYLTSNSFFFSLFFLFVLFVYLFVLTDILD